MKRDILNHLGNKIGELSEPDGVEWTEEIWQQKLAAFTLTPPSNVPKAVTRRQMLLALHQMFGVKKQEILTFIGTLPEPLQYKSLIWFDESQVFERDNELLSQMSPMMGIPTRALDDLFILAATL